jgi:hypothetical protein
MAELNYVNEGVKYRNEEVVISRPNWGAIWAGTFTFIAIWAVFGMLGNAIFVSAVGSGGSHTGLGVGMTIWAVVLTIIALFVAGRVTGQIAGPLNSVTMHAIVMFGLSVTAAVIILLIGGDLLGNTRTTDTAFLVGLFGDLGWPLFVALFLGWLGAIGGAITAHKELPRRMVQQQQPSHAS